MQRTQFQVGFGGALYIVVAALVLGAASFTQANLLFWSFGLMCGGFVVSIVLPWWALRGITVERLLPGFAVAGDRLVLRYHLVNRRRLLPTFNLVIQERWKTPGLWDMLLRRPRATPRPMDETPPRLKGEPTGWVLHLGAGQTIQAEAPCWPLHRGTLRFEGVEISTAFPFGIVRRVAWFDLPGEVLVYPRLYRMNRRVLHRLSQSDPTGTRRLDKSGGAEEFFGLRAYRPGDSLKMIDWKHSARTGEMIAREMTHPTPPRVMLLLDLTESEAMSKDRKPSARRAGGRTGDGGKPRRSLLARLLHVSRPGDDATPTFDQVDPVERAISLAASLICDAHFQGYQIGLAVAGAAAQTFPIHHSLPHRTRLLEALSQLDASRRVAGPDLLLIEPTVVVHPGAGSRRRGIGGAMILNAAEMDQYVDAAPDAAEIVLRRRTVVASRRQQIEQRDDAA